MLLDAGLNQRLYTVYDEDADGRRVRNDAETLAARDKQEAVAVRFSAWVWEEPARAARLAERYNELFRSVVVPAHDGSHLSLPGLADTFTPHPHQRDAVARILTDGRALLAHAVGAGKTATMIMSTMELRRLGLAAKPAVVVPNHMLEQFSREWLQLYPTARLLIADRDRLSRERRKEFVARCATGDWDGVVFTHAGFARIPLGPDLYKRYLEENLERCRAALAESRAGKGLSVKRLERRLAQREERLRELLAAETKDDGVSWVETGIDRVTIDEAHCFKNRQVDSAIDGIATPGSRRAQDLDAKLWALRRIHGPRVVTFATATPVANSIAELWTMQSYLQPDVLAEADLSAFDSWAATFARTVTALELAPDGGSYRMKTRFARFQNVPELITLYRQVADVRTAEDLALPVPALGGGRPETVVVPPSVALRAYVADLASRAEQVRSRSVLPDEDNMLKITGDGRRAALDLRLVGERPDPTGGKLAAAADRIADIHRSTTGLRFVDECGQPHPRPGALQLVFCDVSTPSGRAWNAYDELRGLLVARGMPAEAVRFVHEAATDEGKARLFAACRDGRVAVLVGSTDKMGVGTNVQTRAVALHHLDCPWRPADIEQREGRIIRQGNQNAEVSILRYATEASFDIYMWQTVERKAAFINQVATGRSVEREVDDIGDQALSFAEIKALATGNPLILEKAGLDAEVARLSRLHRSHQDDQHRLRRALSSAETRAARLGRRIAELEAAITQRTDTRGERFEMTLEGSGHRSRSDAGQHLLQVLASRLASPGGSGAIGIGRLGGFDVVVGLDREAGELVVSLDGLDDPVAIPADELLRTDPLGLLRRLEYRIQAVDTSLAGAIDEHRSASREAERARDRLGASFPYDDALKAARRRQHEVNEQLLQGAGEVNAEQTLPDRMISRMAGVTPSPAGPVRR